MHPDPLTYDVFAWWLTKRIGCGRSAGSTEVFLLDHG